MNSAKNDNLDPGLGTRNFVQSGAKLWKLLRFEFAVPLLRNLSLYRYKLDHICNLKTHVWIYQVLVASKTYFYRPQLIWVQQSSEHVKPFGTNWVKIKGAQLKVNLHHPVVHQMLIKNCKITMTIRCILTELRECKVHEKCPCLLMSTLFENLNLQ